MSNLASRVDPDTLDAARAAYRAVCETWERAASEERAAAAAGTLPLPRAEERAYYDRLDRAYAVSKWNPSERRMASNLEQLARELYCGETLRRSDLTEDSKALRHYCRDDLDPDDHETQFIEYGPDEPHHWVLLVDTDSRGRVPRHLPDRAALEAYAAHWRDLHRNLRGRELAVLVVPGEQVIFAVWSPERLDEAGTRELAWALSGDMAEPRFQTLPYPFELPRLPESLGADDDDGVGIYLPAAPMKKLADRQTQAGAITGRPTGIAALDGILSGGYLPRDALVGIGGAFEQCKTTLTLEALENLAAEPDSLNVLLALDEPETALRARRLQRRGLSREAARAALNTEAEHAMLAESDFSIVTAEPGELFEDFIALVLAEAGGRQVNLAIDSIQKLQTRTGAGKEPKARVSAASQAVRNAVTIGRGRLRILFTSEVVPRSGTLKDSSSLGFDADLIVLTTKNRTEDGLSLAVVKNRYGEKATLMVGLDRAGQRLYDVAAGKAAGKPATLRDKVWRVLGDLGTAPGNEIAKAVGGRKADVLAVLRKCREAGELAYGPEGFSFPAGGL